jgi:hypothetical protein
MKRFRMCQQHSLESAIYWRHGLCILESSLTKLKFHSRPHPRQHISSISLSFFSRFRNSIKTRNVEDAVEPGEGRIRKKIIWNLLINDTGESSYHLNYEINATSQLTQIAWWSSICAANNKKSCIKIIQAIKSDFVAFEFTRYDDGDTDRLLDRAQRWLSVLI